MKPRKYYAVLAGDRTGVYDDLKRCMSAVSGYPGARYHEFPDRDSAEEWLAGFEEPAQGPVQRFLPEPRPRIDGNVVDITDIIPVAAEIFASGVSRGPKSGCAALVFVRGDCLPYAGTVEHGVQDAALAATAGELAAVSAAVSFCASQGLPAVRVYPADTWPEALLSGTVDADVPAFMKEYAEDMAKLKDDVAVLFHAPVRMAEDTRMEIATNMAVQALDAPAGPEDGTK